MKRQEMLKFKIEVTTVTKENLVFEGVSVCNETWLPVVYQKTKHKCSYFSLMSQISRMLAECYCLWIKLTKALGALVTTCVLQTGNKSVCMAAGDGMINKSGTTKRVTFSHQVWPHSFS